MKNEFLVDAIDAADAGAMVLGDLATYLEGVIEDPLSVWNTRTCDPSWAEIDGDGEMRSYVVKSIGDMLLACFSVPSDHNKPQRLFLGSCFNAVADKNPLLLELTDSLPSEVNPVTLKIAQACEAFQICMKERAPHFDNMGRFELRHVLKATDEFLDHMRRTLYLPKLEQHAACIDGTCSPGLA